MARLTLEEGGATRSFKVGDGVWPIAQASTIAERTRRSVAPERTSRPWREGDKGIAGSVLQGAVTTRRQRRSRITSSSAASCSGVFTPATSSGSSISTAITEPAPAARSTRSVK